MLEYKTIEGEYFTEWEINKSRFLTYIKHVETEIEAQEFISSIKKNILMLATTVLLISLANAVKSKNQAMMANLVALLELLCLKSSKK